MNFRRMTFIKNAVLRSNCFSPNVKPACANVIQLQSRCLSSILSFPWPQNHQTLQKHSGNLCHQRTHLPSNWQPCHIQLRCLHQSTHLLAADGKKGASVTEEDDDPLVAKYDETGKPLSNWKRMKIMMKTYGYVIIPVHWIIAPAWFGMFYYAIKMGVNIEPMLLKIGVSEDHVNSIQNSGASNALMAYALYKVVTPLRYTVTVGATEMTVRYLRRLGYIKPHPPKEKTYRESLQDTVSGMKDMSLQDMKDKAQDMKDKAQEKAQDFKDKAQDFKDKAQDLKDKAQDLKDKAQELKDKAIDLKDKARDVKDMAQEKLKDKRGKS